MFLKRLKARERRPIVRMDVTAFAAIMIVFVFVFMSRFKPHGDFRMAVDLAVVRHPVSLPGALREDGIHVAIHRDGAIFIAGEKLALDQVRAQLAERMKRTEHPTIYFSCDLRAKWSTIRDTLEQARLAGARRIAFLAEEQRQ